MKSAFPSRLLVVLLGVGVALAPLAAAASTARHETDVVTRIDSYVRGRLPSLHTPGLSLAVVQDDQVILSRGYGLANRDAGTPMTEDTPVAIASTTKGMSALAIMQLVEQGLVDLDAPVVQYVPEFTMDDARFTDITVRHVLTHTAGIPSGGFTDPAQDDHALDRRVASLANVKLHFTPGSSYEYANDGYSIAGLILQRVSGMPYEEYLAQHLFAPLGMQRTTFDVSQASEWGLTGYSKRKGVIGAGPVPLSRGNNPAGGVLSTACDASHYLARARRSSRRLRLSRCGPLSLRPARRRTASAGARCSAWGRGCCRTPATWPRPARMEARAHSSCSYLTTTSESPYWRT